MSQVEVLAPFSGRVVSLEEVPDSVFSEKMLGDGLAVDPIEGVGVAPVTGKLTVFHSACHAFAVQVTDEVSVLVHVGLDTVRMKGEGFTRLAEVGDEVKAGQELVRFDMAAIVATVRAGEDADQALVALEALIAGNFREGE